MNPEERWRRVRDLFEGALERDPAGVDAWLDREAAADDDALRADVRSLLEHHSRAGSFLSGPALDRLTGAAAGRTLEPGQAVGPYTIVRELGRGGMGRVYLATDSRLERQVALKALPPELTIEPAYRERLRREARAAAALAHPGIRAIYALEEFDGDLFMAAEFVDGRTLRDEMSAGGRPSGDEVLRTARALASALAHAHAHGIVHRDLKPDNVMRARDGQLKILDFGLARVERHAPAADASDAGPVTRPGAVLGTPEYMAPEQLRGEPAGAAADVFALGVLLYEYAGGAHPFAAETPLGIAARIMEGEAAPLRERRPDLPAAVADVIHRCLRRSPADRLRSGADVSHALERLDPADAAPPMTRWWRTHQLVVIALYVVACAVGWQIKEWRPGLATALFVAACLASTVGGVLRGHLLFTERVNRRRLRKEHRRAGPITLGADLILAAIMLAAGALVADTRTLTASIAIALGAGIALARLVVEPSTTAAAFRG